MSTQVSPAVARARRIGTVRLRSIEGRAPLLLLAGGMLLIAVLAGVVAAHVTVFALDESIMQQSAVHYSSGLPHTLLHDVDARATDRLYSLVLSIAYRFTGGPAAIRIDHVMSAFMFVSAAVPIYLMGRVLLPSRWAAVAIGLLSVAVPWLTLTSALFTENLSYPLFWWTMLAVCAAVWHPSLRSDLLALVTIGLLIGTRVQFAAIFVGYALCVLGVCWWRAAGTGGVSSRLGRTVRELPHRFPVTVAAFALALLALAYARVNGGWHAHVHHLLGSYSNVVIRDGLPPNMAEGVLIEVLALALGVGLIPAVVAIPWYASRLARPVLERRSVHVAVLVVVSVVFLLLTVYSQGGFLGAITEERYFFYVIPLFWLGAFAAVSEGSLRLGPLFASTLALASLYGVIAFNSPLNEETAFLTPVESIVPRVLGEEIQDLHLTGLTIGDSLTLLALLAGVVTAMLWTRWPRLRAGWVLGVSAILQLAIGGYAFAAVDGGIAGVQGRTSGSTSALGWIDSHAGGQSVTWLDNLAQTAPPAIDVPAAGLAASQAHVTLFWNSQLRGWASVPALRLAPVEFPLSVLPGTASLAVQPQTGELAPRATTSTIQEVVGQTASPFLQLAGASLAHSPDGFLTLTRLTQPARASWWAEGLQDDGFVTSGAPVRISAFVSPSASAARLTAALTFSPAPPLSPTSPSHTELEVTLGRAHRDVALSSGASPRILTMSTCLAPGAKLASGSIAALRSTAFEGRVLAGSLTSVSVSSVPTKAC